MTVLLVIHLIIVLSLIGIILIQPSSSDGFTGAGGGGGLISGRGQANFLTRTTAVLAAAFLINSLILAYMATHSNHQGSIIEQIPAKAAEQVPAAQQPKPQAPAKPAAPQVE